MIVAKTLSVFSAVMMVAEPVLGPQSLISVGCAGAIILAVWSAGRKVKGWEDKIDQTIERQERLEQEVKALKNERNFDLDLMRSEVCGGAPVSNHSYQILVVDDDPNDRLLIRRALRFCNVDEAATLKDCLAKLAVNKYDCTVIDLGLPDSTRQHTIALLMKEQPGSVCVAISGSDDPALASLAVAAGADSYMVKGGNDQYIATMVMHAIRRKAIRS